MQGGRLIVTEHPEQHYRTVFDQRTGFFVRKEEKGWPEPTWAADGPELIDLSITNYCERGCEFCYRETYRREAWFMTLEEVEAVAAQAEACGTMQIALGGGNPNQHPQFGEILGVIRSHEIVPSYTTNGAGLTDEVLKATAEHCGAMAVSVYPPYTEERYSRMLERIVGFGIRVNLHAIIKEDTLDMWTKWLKEPPAFFKYVNAVIFLNYKPVRGGMVRVGYDMARRFFETANECKAVKIGFDSCSMSGIVRWMTVPTYLVEPCEAARFSCFVSEDVKMYPCSFMVGKCEGGDLKKRSLTDIWKEDEVFKKYREDAAPERCLGCQHHAVCKGGCRLFEEINWC